MPIALCPGSFDPVTLGHLDIIERTSRHFDLVIVAVIRNPQKTQSLFSLEERQQMLKEGLSHLSNIRIEFFKGLLVEFAKDHGADAIVKGLRAVSDFDYEFQMANMNRKLAPKVETVFMMTGEDYFYISAQLVREVASYGGSVKGLVPPNVLAKMMVRFGGDVSAMVPKHVNDRLVELFRSKES